MWKKTKCVVAFLYLYFLRELTALPIVDAGVFVVQGVPTCRDGKGYCLLSRSCVVDSDFEDDELNGHCNELTKSFTSKLSFVCCKYVNRTLSPEDNYHTTISTVTVTGEMFELLDKNPIPIMDDNDNEISEEEDISGFVEIVGVVTDTTGIMDVVTRPYTRPTTPLATLATKSRPTFTATKAVSTTPSSEKSDSQTTSREFVSEFSFTTQDATVSSTTQIESTDNQTTDQYTETTDNQTTDQYTGTTTPVEISASSLDMNENLPSLTKPDEMEEHGQLTSSKISHINEENVLKLPVHIREFLNRKVQKSKNELRTAIKELRSSQEVESNDTLAETHPLPAVPSVDNAEISRTTEPTNEDLEPSFLLTRYEESLINDDSYKAILSTQNENQLSQPLTFGSSSLDKKGVRPHPINLNICGLRRASLKVSSYTKSASTYDWCWSAALMTKATGPNSFICTATLIELDLVLTTASCLKKLQGKDILDYRIVLGDSNLWDEMPYGVQYHDIREIVTHPDFLTSDGRHVNDIGLIRLTDLATLDHNVCLACVSQTLATIPSDSCVVTSYSENSSGKATKHLNRFYMAPGMLRESPVKLANDVECEISVSKMISNPLLVPNSGSFVCEDQKKTARGCARTSDEGSPLVCKFEGTWYLTGISSWAVDCHSNPTIYTRVNSFSDWILNARLRMYGFINYTV